MTSSQLYLDDTLLQTYLRHIAVNTEAPSLEFLKRLQQKHVESIPWENCDVLRQKATPLDAKIILNKIIQHQRGGICYELNSLFYTLLKLLGFQVELRFATVYGVGTIVFPAPLPSHLVIIAHFDGKEYLTDVAWDGYRFPLPFTGEPVLSTAGAHRVEYEDQLYTMYFDAEGQWLKQFSFETTAFDLKNIGPYLDYEQGYPKWNRPIYEPFFFRHHATGSAKLIGDLVIISENGKCRKPYTLQELGGLRRVLQDILKVDAGFAESFCIAGEN